MAAIVLKTKEEIELMRESALIVSKTLGMLAACITWLFNFNHKCKLLGSLISSRVAIKGPKGAKVSH